MSNDDNNEFLAYLSSLLFVCFGAFYIGEFFGIANIMLTWIVIAILIGPVSWSFFPSSFKYTWPFVLASIWLALWPALDHWHYSSTLDPLSSWYDYAKPVLYAKWLIKWGLLFAAMAGGMYASRSWLVILRDRWLDR